MANQPQKEWQEKLAAVIARTKNLNVDVSAPPTVHSEMFKVLLDENKVLVAEVERLKQEVQDLRTARRIEIMDDLRRQSQRQRRY